MDEIYINIGFLQHFGLLLLQQLAWAAWAAEFAQSFRALPANKTSSVRMGDLTFWIKLYEYKIDIKIFKSFKPWQENRERDGLSPWETNLHNIV